MEMTTVKTVVVFAIIFGCFAVLYPKIFHPMLLHVLGLNQQASAPGIGNHEPGVGARDAHLQTLEWQAIPYRPGYESQLYHPDVIRAYPEYFNPAAHP